MKISNKTTPSPDNKTIDYYNYHAEEYAQRTLNLQLSEQWKEFTKHLKPKALILDVGCGSGRDMIEFQKQGFATEGLEPSSAMAQIARLNSGSLIHETPIETINFNEKFDGIWACASLLHVKKDNLPQVIKSILKALKNNGLLYFSLKQGKGQTRNKDERLFAYYNEKSIRAMLKKMQNMNIINIWITEDSAGRRDNTWINCITQKTSET